MSSEEELSFTCFPKLSTEIRLMIWESVSFLERDVDVTLEVFCSSLKRLPFENEDRQGFRYKSSTPPPAILHVNREARMIGLRHYKLTFGVEYRSQTYNYGDHQQPKIYANFASDRLWFRGGQEDLFYHYFWLHFFGYGVRRVALPVGPDRSEEEDVCHTALSCHLWLHEPVEEVVLYHLDARGITFGRSTIETEPLTEENCGRTAWEEFEETEADMDGVLDEMEKTPNAFKSVLKKELKSIEKFHFGYIDPDNGWLEICSSKEEAWEKFPPVKKVMLV